jgi:adenosylcobyric acid synthase
LLPIETVFEPDKRTQQSRCVSAWPVPGRTLVGYEIHHGRSSGTGGGDPLLDDAGAEMGWRQGRAVGCYLHGLLAEDQWRGAFLNVIRQDRGRSPQPVRSADAIDLRIDRWAQHLRRSLRGNAWSLLLSLVK